MEAEFLWNAMEWNFGRPRGKTTKAPNTKPSKQEGKREKVSNNSGEPTSESVPQPFINPHSTPYTKEPALHVFYREATCRHAEIESEHHTIHYVTAPAARVALNKAMLRKLSLCLPLKLAEA